MAITRQFIRGLRVCKKYNKLSSLLQIICFQGVDNVYAQHVPLIKDLLDQLVRGKLKDTSYPNVNAKDQFNQQTTTQQQGQPIK